MVRQRRKLRHRIEHAPDEDHARYLNYLLGLFDDAVAAGNPQPASQFLPMYAEEFE